jgi:hypothetical protein
MLAKSRGINPVSSEDEVEALPTPSLCSVTVILSFHSRRISINYVQNH